MVRQKKIVLMVVDEIFNRPNDSDLSDLLKTSWGSRIGGKIFSDEMTVREFNLPNGDSLIMNTGISTEDGFLGEIVGFEPDGFLVVARRDASVDKKRLHLRQLRTDKDEDPYKGITYFYCYKNYILFLDGGIRYQNVQSYMSWMIEHAFKITKRLYVQLNPLIHVDGDQAVLVGATSLEIRPAPYLPDTPIEGYIADNKDVTEKVSDKSTTARLLEVLNLSYPSFQRYREATGGEGVIEVEVKIKLKNKNKLIPVSRNLKLSSLMEANPDSDFILKGKGGTTRGSLVRANFIADVKYTGSLPDEDSVSDAFRAALKDFIARGCVK